MVILFTIQYQKILKIHFGKFSDSLPFISILIIYSILGIFYAKYDFLDNNLLGEAILAFPLFLGIYGAKYFKSDYSMKQFYHKLFLFDKITEKEIWYDYNTASGLSKKLTKIELYIVIVILIAIIIDIFFYAVAVLVSIDYLFFILACGWIIKDYLSKKIITIKDGATQSFKFLRYSLNLKGLPYSLGIIFGYYGWGMLLVYSINNLFGLSIIPIGEYDITHSSGILILLAFLPLFFIAFYMFLYQYKLSRRFPKFIKVFYGEKLAKGEYYPSLPHGGDKITVLSFVLISAILFLLRKSEGKITKSYLPLYLFAAISICIFYIILIILSFSSKKMNIAGNLKRDNFRLPLVSFAPAIIFYFIIKLFHNKEEHYLIYITLCFFIIFYIYELLRKLETLHLNKSTELLLQLLFFCTIEGIAIMTAPEFRFGIFILGAIVEVAIISELIFIFSDKRKK